MSQPNSMRQIIGRSTTEPIMSLCNYVVDKPYAVYITTGHVQNVGAYFYSSHSLTDQSSLSLKWPQQAHLDPAVSPIQLHITS
jgi:hypothetical protein